ncbi:MAG: hypothetical protein ACK5M7_18790 [Draconibacterium sp.]
MFTFGIFTTHIPYLAFLFFYAYLFLFGVEKAGDGTIRVAEKSQSIEFNLNSQHKIYLPDQAYHFDNQNKKEEYTLLPQVFEKPHRKGRFKHSLYKQDSNQGYLFCRPPPVFA